MQIDTTLQEKILNMAIFPKYADEMMDEIMLMVQGNLKGDNALNEIRQFSNLKRSKFNSTKEFITEFQKQYYVLCRFKIQPHPLHALAQILTELENEVPKAQFIVEELGKIEPKKVTLSHVEQYCKSLQAVTELNTGTTNAQSAGNRGGRGSNRGRGRGGRGGNRGNRGRQSNER